MSRHDNQAQYRNMTDYNQATAEDNQLLLCHCRAKFVAGNDRDHRLRRTHYKEVNQRPESMIFPLAKSQLLVSFSRTKSYRHIESLEVHPLLVCRDMGIEKSLTNWSECLFGLDQLTGCRTARNMLQPCTGSLKTRKLLSCGIMLAYTCSFFCRCASKTN